MSTYLKFALLGTLAVRARKLRVANHAVQETNPDRLRKPYLECPDDGLHAYGKRRQA